MQDTTNKVNLIQIFIFFIQLLCQQKYCFVFILQGRGNIKNYCFHEWPITIKRDISETKVLFFIWSYNCSWSTKCLIIEQGLLKYIFACSIFMLTKMLFCFPKQLYWNHTLAYVFFCKFAAYFQSTFSSEHLWTAASGFSMKWSVLRYRWLRFSKNIWQIFVVKDISAIDNNK